MDFPSLSFGRGRNRPAGLDVTAERAVAAVAGAGGDVRTASRPLPPGLVHDGEVQDPTALGNELRALFAENSLGRSVRIGLASPRVIVRRLEVPAIVSGPELDAAVRFQAADALPTSLDEVVFDYQALDAEGDKRRVVLAAARRDIAERWRAAIEFAGLKLEGIDLAGFALARALADQTDPTPGVGTLLVHLGDVTTMALVEGEACVFARVAAAGADPVAEARAVIAFHAGAPGAQPTGRVVLSGGSADWAATVAAFEQQLGIDVRRAGSEVVDGDRFVLATGLTRVGEKQVAVDLRGVAGADQRRRESASAPVRKLIAPVAAGAVALIAAGGYLYVHADHTLKSRNHQAATLQNEANAATQQANALKPFQTLAAERTSRESAVRGVAVGRMDWATVMRGVAAKTPKDVVLTSMNETVAPGAGTGGSSGGGGSSLRGTVASPAVELTGCAPSHPGVSHMIGEMEKVKGVTLVTLESSQRLSQTAGGSATTGGDCRDGNDKKAQFSMVLFFQHDNPIVPGAASTGTTATPTSSTTSSTPSTTSGTSTTPSTTSTTPSTTTTTGSGG